MEISPIERARIRAHQRRLDAARTDVNAFIEFCFLHRGKPLQQGDVHRKWHAHVKRHKMAGIIAPRDHGKSQQFGIYYVIFRMGQDPDIRIKLVCNDLPKAMKRVRAIRSHCMQNPRVTEVFPHLKVDPVANDWTAATITVQRESCSPEPTLEARGILTSGTGGRADLLVFDDICDYRNSIKNPKEREAIKQAFREDWMNLLEPDGEAVYIGTPWHREDMTHALMEQPEWRFLKTAINDRLDPIWPEMWPREALHARLALIGQVAFDRGFKCKTVVDEEDQIFTETDLEAAKDPSLSLEAAVRMTAGWVRYTGVDLASGKRTRKAKYGVVLTVAINPENRQRVLLNIQRKREPSPRFFRRIALVYQSLAPAAIVVENNAIQHALIELAKESELKGLPIKSIHTGSEKADLEIGLPGLAAEFESRLWRIPFAGKHPTGCRCNVCLFFNECRDGLMSETTDILMAAWLATRLITRRSKETSVTSTPRPAQHTTEWDPRGLDPDGMVARRRSVHYDS